MFSRISTAGTTEFNDAVLPSEYGLLTSKFPKYRPLLERRKDVLSCMSFNCSMPFSYLPNTM